MLHSAILADQAPIRKAQGSRCYTVCCLGVNQEERRAYRGPWGPSAEN